MTNDIDSILDEMSDYINFCLLKFDAIGSSLDKSFGID